MKQKIFILILFLFSSSNFAFQVATQPMVKQIIEAYNRFEYKETDRLIEAALNDIEKFPITDQILIYEYAAFRKFQTNDALLTEQYFYKILEIDPTFNPDPVTTPPKILSLFQKTKLAYLESINSRLAALEQSVFDTEKPWRAFVYPGWEQLHRGYKTKGYVWIAVTTLAIGGGINAVVKANDREDAYQNERNPNLISEKFDAYNAAYRSQFYWGYALAGLWVINQIDAMVFSPKSINPNISINLIAAPNEMQFQLRIPILFPQN